MISLQDRMDAKTDKTGDCWVWTACRNARGYGKVNVGGVILLAHRVAFELANGISIPEGMHVRHHCDNPPCVNPAHLAVGTHTDNMRDMDERHRRVSVPQRGERHGRAKLTERDVRELFRLRNDLGLTQQVLADRFGISQVQVGAILRGRMWSHLNLISAS